MTTRDKFLMVKIVSITAGICWATHPSRCPRRFRTVLAPGRAAAEDQQHHHSPPLCRHSPVASFRIPTSFQLMTSQFSREESTLPYWWWTTANMPTEEWSWTRSLASTMAWSTSLGSLIQLGKVPLESQESSLPLVTKMVFKLIRVTRSTCVVER